MNPPDEMRSKRRVIPRAPGRCQYSPPHASAAVGLLLAFSARHVGALQSTAGLGTVVEADRVRSDGGRHPESRGAAGLLLLLCPLPGAVGAGVVCELLPALQ